MSSEASRETARKLHRELEMMDLRAGEFEAQVAAVIDQDKAPLVAVLRAVRNHLAGKPEVFSQRDPQALLMRVEQELARHRPHQGDTSNA